MWDLHRKEGERTLWLSSSGGGLFGRPMTRKSYGALLNFWELFSSLPTARLHLYNLFRMYNSGQLVEIEDFLMLTSTPFAERRFEA
jgi:hypothetical protein